MPFQFTCPYCYKKTLVDDKYAGQSGYCAACGKSITLPQLELPVPVIHRQTSSSLYVADHSQSTGISELIGADSPPQTQATADSFALGQSTNSNEVNGLRNAASLPPVVAAQVLPPNSTLASQRKRRTYWLMGVGTISVVVLGVVAYGCLSIFFSSNFFQQLQHQRERALCMNNLSKIARALNTYAATHGTYPPAVVYDDTGQPKHSWRVLILRELGEHSLYDQYNFDEPWNSPNNAQLFPQCPRTYISPGVGRSGESNYFLVVGGNTLFPNAIPMKPADIVDGTSNTILVVEAKNMIHEWSKPIDVTAGGNSAIPMGGNHEGGQAAATADGSPLWIPTDTPTELINALITPAGGEPVDATAFGP